MSTPYPNAAQKLAFASRNTSMDSEPTDTQMLNWLSTHPNCVTYHRGVKGRTRGWWRIVFGPKDETNRFPSLRAVVVHAMAADAVTSKSKNLAKMAG